MNERRSSCCGKRRPADKSGSRMKLSTPYGNMSAGDYRKKVLSRFKESRGKS